MRSEAAQRISVQGRSRRLSLSYRTTQEILAWAVPPLGAEPVTGLDGEASSLLGYRSPMRGQPDEDRRRALRRLRDRELGPAEIRGNAVKDLAALNKAIGAEVRRGRNSSSTQTFDAAEEEIVAFRRTERGSCRSFSHPLSCPGWH